MHIYSPLKFHHKSIHTGTLATLDFYPPFTDGDGFKMKNLRC